jgi:hypothetical protein
MDAQTVITIGIAVVTGIGIPLMTFWMARQDSDRREKFKEMHSRLDHLDVCLDGVRETIYSKGVNREELIHFKADMTEAINRMRAAISAETTALGQRIYRLEDRQLGERGSD